MVFFKSNSIYGISCTLIYRKQTTCNRVIYGSDMNKLYVQDLNAQIAMNNKIKEAVKSREDSMPSDKSLPIGFDKEARSKKRTKYFMC